MALRTRVEPLDRDIAILVDETLSPAAQSRAVATFARAQLAAAQDVNRRVLGRIPPIAAVMPNSVKAQSAARTAAVHASMRRSPCAIAIANSAVPATSP